MQTSSHRRYCRSTPALGFNHHDGVEAAPSVMRLEPSDLVDDPAVARLYPAVIGIDRLMVVDRRHRYFKVLRSSTKTATSCAGFPDCP